MVKLAKTANDLLFIQAIPILVSGNEPAGVVLDLGVGVREELEGEVAHCEAFEQDRVDVPQVHVRLFHEIKPLL